MKAEVLEEVKKEVQKMLDAGLHERGIEIGLKCQEAVKAMKPPTTKKELQKLIGKINFVRWFISSLSGCIEPFMGLVKIKSEDELHWG